MVVARRTSKNQLTLAKAVVEQAGMADYYGVVCDNAAASCSCPSNPAYT